MILDIYNKLYEKHNAIITYIIYMIDQPKDNGIASVCLNYYLYFF